MIWILPAFMLGNLWRYRKKLLKVEKGKLNDAMFDNHQHFKQHLHNSKTAFKLTLINAICTSGIVALALMI